MIVPPFTVSPLSEGDRESLDEFMNPSVFTRQSTRQDGNRLSIIGRPPRNEHSRMKCRFRGPALIAAKDQVYVMKGFEDGPRGVQHAMVQQVKGDPNFTRGKDRIKERQMDSAATPARSPEYAAW